MDYNALTAWGTLLAVAVALGLGVYPILKESRDKRATASRVRRQFVAILISMWQRFMHEVPQPTHAYHITDRDRADLGELRGVYPQVTLLSSGEEHSITKYYFALSAAFAVDSILSEQVLSLADSCLEALKSMGSEAEGAGYSFSGGAREKAMVKDLEMRRMVMAWPETMRTSGLDWSKERPQVLSSDLPEDEKALTARLKQVQDFLFNPMETEEYKPFARYLEREISDRLSIHASRRSKTQSTVNLVFSIIAGVGAIIAIVIAVIDHLPKN